MPATARARLSAVDEAASAEGPSSGGDRGAADPEAADGDLLARERWLLRRDDD